MRMPLRKNLAFKVFENLVRAATVIPPPGGRV
jgi:hypothetical protein